MFFQEIEAKFALLDDIPDALYTDIVTHTHGDLMPRVKAILHWRQCLLKGILPEESDLKWPEDFIKRTILMRLETLDIAPFCREQETLTDSVLKDILGGISSAEDYFALKPGGFVDKLAQRQKINNKDSSFKDKEGLADHVPPSNNKPKPSAQSQSQTKQNQESQSASTQINQSAAQGINLTKPITSNDSESELTSPFVNQQSPTSSHNAASTADDDIQANIIITEQLDKNWQELADSWHELSTVYTEFGELLGKGWDLSQGILSAQGWRDIIRYRKLLQELPELQKLMATLGRLRHVAGEDAVNSLSEQVFNPIIREVTVEQETWTDRAAMETGGIVLSDDLSRLLPSELAMLGHPKLKMLWYAKRAERKLLTYCHCGLMPDLMLVEQELDINGPPKEDRSSKAYGPIIICLDTSASMQGMPETIAKALILEGLRIAFNEQRHCFVYAFGGLEQVLEHELDLTQGGLTKLLKFLQQSFNGGTDVVHPLLVALEKQKTEGWQDADILLISDGRFPVQTLLFNRVEKLKKQQGLRLHGLLLGNWKSDAIKQLCEPLHYYSAWDTNKQIQVSN